MPIAVAPLAFTPPLPVRVVLAVVSATASPITFIASVALVAPIAIVASVTIVTPRVSLFTPDAVVASSLSLFVFAPLTAIAAVGPPTGSKISVRSCHLVVGVTLRSRVHGTSHFRTYCRQAAHHNEHAPFRLRGTGDDTSVPHTAAVRTAPMATPTTLCASLAMPA